jgi:hypothetical protein
VSVCLSRSHKKLILLYFPSIYTSEFAIRFAAIVKGSAEQATGII